MPDLSRKLKRLNAAVHSLAAAKDQQELVQHVLDIVQQVFGRETAAVLLREPGEERLRIVASRGYQSEVVAEYHARLGEGVAGRVAATGQPRLVADVSREPDYLPGVRAARSEMAVPLTDEGEVIGVLDVESRETAFGEEDMALLSAFGEQVAWALRHGRILAEAQERARRMELLNRASRALNAEHDPDELLYRILALADEALGFHNVAVLVADAGQLIVRKALRPGRIEGLRLPADQGISGHVFQRGQAVIVPDVSRDPRYIAGGLEGARSEMAAPLRLDGQIIGVLDAESREVDAFAPLDLEVFSAFAAHVAAALRTAQLVSDLEDRARRLDCIARSGRALNGILDLDDLLADILLAADEALGLGRAALLLCDPDRPELVVQAARGYGSVNGKRIAMGQGVTGFVAQSGEPMLVRDTAKEPRYIAAGGASEMAVPLRLYGRVLGVLDTESRDPAAYTEAHLELFGVFADLAAVAIHNARLFARLEAANARLKANVDEISRLNRDLEAYAKQISAANSSLESQIRQLTALHQAGQAITSSLDLKETLSAILKVSSEIVHSSTGAIKLMDADTKELRLAASQAESGGEQGDHPLARLDLPLRIGSRTIGVFELVHQVDERLDESQQKMLETLASQAAIAIENARLFEDTQRTYYETLRSLAKALEARDDYTRGHSERVAELALAIARELKLEDADCALIHSGALLHDIGKIGVPDAVLLKPGPLTEDEMQTIRKHPTFGIAILGPLKFLGKVSELVMRHHERWDGTGYPSGLRAEEIPLASRIIGVADSYDAMTSSRPYRSALSHDEAMAEIRRWNGKQHDPAVVEAFERVIARKKQG